MILNFIWNISPEIFTIGPFQFKWHILLLVAGILLARQTLFFFYKREGGDVREAKSVFNSALIGAVIGARLFYVAFIDTSILFNRPAQIFLPFDFSQGLRFVGENQFSMLGALAGMMVSIFIYSRRKDRPFLSFLDKAFLLFTVVLVFVRVGNFFQSEYIGKSTDSPLGILFANKVEHGLQKLPCCTMRNPGGENPLDTVKLKPGKTLLHRDVGYQPLIIYVFFKDGATEQLVNEFLIGDVKAFLFELPELIFEPGTEPLHYTIFIEGVANYMARIQTIGVARHPLQLYEAFIFLILSLLLIWDWGMNYKKSQVGKLAGISLIAITAIHFMIEFLNTIGNALINSIPFTRDQYLCLPFLFFGASMLFLSFRKKKV